jgi:hypothetical protein
MLARPFDRRIAQSGHTDATWQATFYGSLHDIGCKKCERYIVRLTWRTLQLSRFAIVSTFAFASMISSLSQRRPRDIDAINVARVSDRIGRACCGNLGQALCRCGQCKACRHCGHADKTAELHLTLPGRANEQFVKYTTHCSRSSFERNLAADGTQWPREASNQT